MLLNVAVTTKYYKMFKLWYLVILVVQLNYVITISNIILTSKKLNNILMTWYLSQYFIQYLKPSSSEQKLCFSVESQLLHDEWRGKSIQEVHQKKKR